MPLVVRPILQIVSLVFGSILCTAAAPAQLAVSPPQFSPLPQFSPPPRFSVGAAADLAVFSVERGKFGFVDMNNQRKDGDHKLVCQLTIRAGKVVYDLNGISSDMWDSHPTSDNRLAGHWTTLTTRDDNKREPPAEPVMTY